MAKINIRQLMSGGIITNYFCSSSCGHCLYNCSPKWEKRYIDPDTAANNLNTIRSLGCRSVHIGGGEPMLRADDLAAVLGIAAEMGVSVEYVETNSSWLKWPKNPTDLVLKKTCISINATFALKYAPLWCKMVTAGPKS